jgi:hypothetical protein
VKACCQVAEIGKGSRELASIATRRNADQYQAYPSGMPFLVDLPSLADKPEYDSKRRRRRM